MDDSLPRKLTAILYADVAGYSRLTGEDEDATHRLLREFLDLISDTVEQHHGRVMHYAGDAVLAQFSAVVDALTCAVAVQTALAERNHDLPSRRKVLFRVGVNLGDVIEDRGDIYGDGVNVAARLEALADPGGICISESVRTTVGNKLSVGYEYQGEQEVKNIAEPVRAYLIRFDQSESPERIERVSATSLIPDGVSLELPDRPSIAVLPFANMSGDPEQEFFSDGITEDIITDLARLENLFVIARNSAFTYKGQHVDVRQVGEELGVRFVLEGSVRKSGDRVRITAQLVDARNGEHLWVQRYDRQLQDIFAVQDEITREIATELEVKLVYGEQARVWHRGTNNSEAYELVLQGREIWRRFNRLDVTRGRQLIEKALALDPNFAYAMVMLGNCYITEGLTDRANASGSLFDRAIELGHQALSLDGSLGDAHAMLCQAYRYSGEHDKAVEHGESAVQLNPDSADANMFYCGGLLSVGRGEEALEYIEIALRLNPFPSDLYLRFLGDALLAVGRFEDAIATFRQCVSRLPHMTNAQIGLTRAYMEAGRAGEAQAQALEVQRIVPEFSSSSHAYVLGYKDAATKSHIVELLCLAGLPE